MRITTCNACKKGDHKNHHHVVQAVPEGMYGGAVCICEGECLAKADYRPEPLFGNRFREAFKVLREWWRSRREMHD